MIRNCIKFFNRTHDTIKYHVISKYLYLQKRYFQGRIQEFQNGAARSRRVEFLDLRFALMLLHTYPMFLLDIHIVNTACWLKSKYLRIYNENVQKHFYFIFFYIFIFISIDHVLSYLLISRVLKKCIYILNKWDIIKSLVLFWSSVSTPSPQPTPQKRCENQLHFQLKV